MTKIAAMLADGFEEVEALAVIDILRRADIETHMISVSSSKRVTGAHNISIEADMLLENTALEEYNGIFLPGGMPGTNNLDGCEKLCRTILDFDKEKKLLAAICAAPKIYGRLGILKGKKAVCYPGYEACLTGAEVKMQAKVVKDGHVITSRGMGTAIDLGLALVEELKDKNISEELAAAIQYR